jgi:hypothetical protein
MKKITRKNRKKYTRKIRKKYQKKQKKIMKGGLVTIGNIPKEQAILNMMENKTMKFERTHKRIYENEFISCIYTLTVENVPQFYEERIINIVGTIDTSRDINTILFKFVFIDELDNSETEINENYHNEFTRSNFENESNIQKMVYDETNKIKGNNVCPDVIHNVIFENNLDELDEINKRIFEKLSELLNVHSKKKETKVQSVIRTLIEETLNKNETVRGNIKLGMIVMEYADPNHYVVLKKIEEDRNQYNIACEYVLAEIIIMFVYLDLILWDCNSTNILARVDGKKPLLIDFGRTFYSNEIPKRIKQIFETEKKRSYDKELEKINSNKKLFKEHLDKLNSGNDEKGESKRILNTLINQMIQFITLVDFSANNFYYKRPYPQNIDLFFFLHNINILNFYDKKTFKLKEFLLRAMNFRYYIYQSCDDSKINKIIDRIIELRFLKNPVYESTPERDNIFSNIFGNINNIGYHDNNIISRKKRPRSDE